MASRSPVSTSRETIRDVAADAHYLSSNCVVYVYYSDVRAVIEEHFSKALGSQQQNNFPGDNKTKGEFCREKEVRVFYFTFETKTCHSFHLNWIARSTTSSTSRS